MNGADARVVLDGMVSTSWALADLLLGENPRRIVEAHQGGRVAGSQPYQWRHVRDGVQVRYLDGDRLVSWATIRQHGQTLAPDVRRRLEAARSAIPAHQAAYPTFDGTRDERPAFEAGPAAAWTARQKQLQAELRALLVQLLPVEDEPMDLIEWAESVE